MVMLFDGVVDVGVPTSLITGQIVSRPLLPPYTPLPKTFHGVKCHHFSSGRRLRLSHLLNWDRYPKGTVSPHLTGTSIPAFPDIFGNQATEMMPKLFMPFFRLHRHFSFTVTGPPCVLTSS